MSSDVIDLQVSERLTALKAACTVLEAKQGGKISEAKLQQPPCLHLLPNLGGRQLT